MKAHCGGNEVEDSVSPVNLLRSGLDEPNIRRVPVRGLTPRPLQHVGIGVDRDNRGEMRQQSKEHLHRPAAQIKGALSPIEPALGYHPVHKFHRVRNTRQYPPILCFRHRFVLNTWRPSRDNLHDIRERQRHGDRRSSEFTHNETCRAARGLDTFRGFPFELLTVDRIK